MRNGPDLARERRGEPMKTRWFKRAMTGLAFAAATVMAVPVNALACT